MKNVTQVPQREATTAVQVNVLLGIANTMLGALLVPNHNIVEPHHEKPQLDGGCKSAAEMTYIEVCNRLTDILRDKSRWAMDMTKALEIQALRINQEHIETLKSKKKAVEWLCTPSFRLKPELTRIQDGMFAAHIGDLDKPEEALIGIGRTPESAFAAFDELFAGRIPQDMIDYLAAKDQQINEKNQDVDTGAENETEGPEKAGD